MSLSYPELKHLADLQHKEFKLANQISELKKMLHQLADDHCDISISFTMHNKTICEANQAKAEVEHVITAEVGMAGFRSFIAQNTPSNCQSGFAFSFGECSGIRILNQVLLEKQTDRAVTLQEIEVMLKKLATETVIEQALSKR